jgi:cell wall-associated NlpC family hydrolase
MAACAFVVAVTLALTLTLGGRGGSPPPSDRADTRVFDPQLRSSPRVVEPEVGTPVVSETEFDPKEVPRDPEARLAQPPETGPGSGPSPGAPTDAEVRAELQQIYGTRGGKAQVLPSGEAVAPAGAPLLVKQIIAAGNAIARTPYLWGGGHARLYDRGYDCSGSLSFAFIHAGLLDRPIAQGWSVMGESGPGRWISVYSNPGHVFMVVAGLRFDTSAIHIAGSRWTEQTRSTAGFTVRHLPGL